MIEIIKEEDRIDKARKQYIYESDEDSPYPQESIDESEKQEIMKESKEAFRQAIETNQPIKPEVVEIKKNIFYDIDYDMIVCPKCEYWAIYKQTKYCPLCWVKIKRLA